MNLNGGMGDDFLDYILGGCSWGDFFAGTALHTPFYWGRFRNCIIRHFLAVPMDDEMKIIKFPKDEYKTPDQWRAEQTLRDIQEVIHQHLSPKPEGVTYRLDQLSFHVGGLYWYALGGVVWLFEDVTGIFSFIWRMF